MQPCMSGISPCGESPPRHHMRAIALRVASLILDSTGTSELDVQRETELFGHGVRTGMAACSTDAHPQEILRGTVQRRSPAALRRLAVPGRWGTRTSADELT